MRRTKRRSRTFGSIQGSKICSLTVLNSSAASYSVTKANVFIPSSSCISKSNSITFSLSDRPTCASFTSTCIHRFLYWASICFTASRRLAFKQNVDSSHIVWVPQIWLNSKRMAKKLPNDCKHFTTKVGCQWNSNVEEESDSWNYGRVSEIEYMQVVKHP